MKKGQKFYLILKYRKNYLLNYLMMIILNLI